MYCEKCGKKLIERLPNGLFRFMFGKRDKENERVPVDMYIYGSIKMKCIKGSCGYWNVIHFFPPQFKAVQSAELNTQSDMEILRENAIA